MNLKTALITSIDDGEDMVDKKEVLFEWLRPNTENLSPSSGVNLGNSEIFNLTHMKMLAFF